MDPVELLRLFLDRERLAVAGALSTAHLSISEVVEATGLQRRSVLDALAEFRLAGFVSANGDSFTLDLRALRAAAQAVATPEEPMDPIVARGMNDEEQLVLSRFFRGTVLREMPTSRTKRRIVLQRLALEFEVGRRYSEREVNDALAVFGDDYVTPRRYLVDEGFLDRESDEYWRCGGAVRDPSFA